MEMFPNAALGFHLVRTPADPPPFHVRKPKGRTERSTRPKGRRPGTPRRPPR